MKHRLCGTVDELHTALSIEDEHAFDHARKDGFHSRAVARQLLRRRAQLLHVALEGARNRRRFRRCRNQDASGARQST